MRRSSEFTSVVRAGFRARTGRVAVHFAPVVGAATASDAADPAPLEAPVVGFVVSKSVGNSVQRHAVVRRLRAQMADRLDGLPASSGTVVRALPAAASASSAELGRDLDRALSRVRSAAGAR
jgi:ribonuclease P protein component